MSNIYSQSPYPAAGSGPVAGSEPSASSGGSFAQRCCTVFSRDSARLYMMVAFTTMSLVGILMTLIFGTTGSQSSGLRFYWWSGHDDYQVIKLSLMSFTICPKDQANSGGPSCVYVDLSDQSGSCLSTSKGLIAGYTFLMLFNLILLIYFIVHELFQIKRLPYPRLVSSLLSSGSATLAMLYVVVYPQHCLAVVNVLGNNLAGPAFGVMTFVVFLNAATFFIYLWRRCKPEPVQINGQDANPYNPI